MIDTTIHDDGRDAIALIRACLDGDTAAAKVIHDNCDLGGVLAVVTGIAVQALIGDEGEDSAREWLDRLQRDIQREDAGEDTP